MSKKFKYICSSAEAAASCQKARARAAPTCATNTSTNKIKGADAKEWAIDLGITLNQRAGSDFTRAAWASSS